MTTAVIVACAALVGLLGYGLASNSADTSIEQALSEGRRPAAPATRLPALGAQGAASLADHRGKVVVLNFWASWCKPCRDEMPLLQRTHEKLAARGGLVLGIDSKDTSESALEFLRRYDITFPSLRDRDGDYWHEYGGTGVPETFLIDRQGRIAAVRRFPVTQEWLDRELPKVLHER